MWCSLCIYGVRWSGKIKYLVPTFSVKFVPKIIKINSCMSESQRDKVVTFWGNTVYYQTLGPLHLSKIRCGWKVKWRTFLFAENDVSDWHIVVVRWLVGKNLNCRLCKNYSVILHHGQFHVTYPVSRWSITFFLHKLCISVPVCLLFYIILLCEQDMQPSATLRYHALLPSGFRHLTDFGLDTHTYTLYRR